MDDLPTAVVVNDQPEPTQDEPAPLVPEEPKREPTWLDLLIAVGIIWSVELVLGVGLMLAAGGPDLWRVPFGLLAVALLGTGATVAVAWVFGCAKHGRGFREGFAIRPVSTRAWVWGLVIGVVASVLAAWILSFAPEGDSLVTKLAKQPEGMAVLVTIALVLPPFEELYYRGFLYPILARYLGGAAAVAIVSVWFGFAHVGQLAGDWIGVPVVLTMGVVWTVMRHRTGSVVPGMVCHLAYNAGLVALSLVTS